MDPSARLSYQGAVAPPLIATMAALGIDAETMARVLFMRDIGVKPLGFMKNGQPMWPISGASVDGFIPTVWAGSLLRALRKAQVLTQPGVVNRDYEGDIANVGDSVRIGQIGDPTISSYTKNTDISAPEALTDAQTTLVIDTGKYFNFQVDDVDQVQTRIGQGLITEAMSRAAYKLKDQEDTAVAALYTDADSANAVGSSGAPKNDLGTAGKAYEWLVQLGIELDEANVPSDGRWAAVPPWYVGAMLKDDRFVKSGTDSAAATLRNGEVGEAAGFAILKSNNVSNDGTTWRIMAGDSSAISFAEQISKVEAYRPERRFADAVKGLLLFGTKVVRPEALAVLYANKP